MSLSDLEMEQYLFIKKLQTIVFAFQGGNHLTPSPDQGWDIRRHEVGATQPLVKKGLKLSAAPNYTTCTN